MSLKEHFKNSEKLRNLAICTSVLILIIVAFTLDYLEVSDSSEVKISSVKELKELVVEIVDAEPANSENAPTIKLEAMMGRSLTHEERKILRETEMERMSNRDSAFAKFKSKRHASMEGFLSSIQHIHDFSSDDEEAKY